MGQGDIQDLAEFERREVGPYRLIGVLGRGGMGTVYLAEQDQAGVARKVAIKVLRHGLASEEAARRFRLERQVLAQLEHVYIARLYDGGETAQGEPYLVMEYIPGVPLDAYCDARSLSVHERLRLFLKILRAVAYSHQHRIVHRDLKPRNILITADGTPKLLDFGIAKPLEALATGESLFETSPERGLMTPLYASPEQIRGEQVTTATDVYAAGVVLYELLTGLSPYADETTARPDGYEAMQRIVDEHRVGPSSQLVRWARSTRSRTADERDTFKTVANNRNEASIDRLHSRLAGDLDTLVLKAIEQDPKRRYSTMEAFADDIERYLESKPISARPATLGYRARKLIRRNAWPLAAGATMLALILVLAVGALMGLHTRPTFQEEPTPRLSNVQLVSNFEGSHAQPSLSPDGAFLAFVSDADSLRQIWVKSLADGSLTQLTSGDAPATAPSWSPKDNVILFERPTAAGSPGVWVVDPFGSDPARLIVSNGQAPRFSKSGDSFTFTRNLATHVASLDGQTIAPLEGTPELAGFAEPMPAMNAGGDVALVLADEGPFGDLWLYRSADGGFSRLTTSDGPQKVVGVRAPAWLPGGKSLLFTASETGDETDAHLWFFDVETARLTALTSGVGGYSAPAISADGSRLVYAHQRPMWRLIATDMDTGAHRVIHSSREAIYGPTVSADGEEIVYFGEHVFTIPVAGGKPQQRTFGPRGQAILPTWSRGPDDHIYYYRDRELHRLDPTTGASDLVLEDFHWSSKNWLAVHPERLAYNHRVAAPQHTVVVERATGESLILNDRVIKMHWSRDGNSLLGLRPPDQVLVICHAPDFACDPIVHQGEALRGNLPSWSLDERRIIFRKLRRDRPGYAWIWAVDRSGTTLERLVEIGPFDPQATTLGVGQGDTIVWLEYDPQGDSEIWMAELKGLSLER